LAVDNAVQLEWERLRGMLRFAILCGDVVEQGGKWDEWGPSGVGTLPTHLRGLDSDRRSDYWQILKALLQLRANDPFGHELIRRDVGSHCSDERCRRGGEAERALVHWHKISWTDLRERHTVDALKERRDAAQHFVVVFCKD